MFRKSGFSKVTEMRPGFCRWICVVSPRGECLARPGRFAGRRGVARWGRFGDQRTTSTMRPLTLSTSTQVAACCPVAGVPGREQVTFAVTVAFSGISMGVTQW